MSCPLRCHWVHSLVITCSLATAVAVPVRAQTLPDDTTSLPWVVDGGVVAAVARVENRLYLGGDFRHVAPRSRLIGPFGAFGPVAGELVAAEPAISGQAFAVTSDGAGGWFVAGTLDDAGVPSRLVRINAQGRRAPWGPDTLAPFSFGSIRALVRVGDVLYLAGDFLSVGGQERRGAAAIQISTQTVLPWSPHIEGGSRVSAMHIDGDDVFLGGAFTSVGGVPRANIARVDRTTGAVLPFAPNTGSVDTASVNALATTATRIYVGGIFSAVDGVPRRNFAAFDRATGALLTLQPNPGQGDPFAMVDDIVVAGGRVLLGGLFSNVAGVPRMNAAALDEATGLLAPWAPVTGGNIVRSIAVTPLGVYLGGDVVASSRARQAIKVNELTGALDPAWDPAVGGEVTQVFWDGSRVAIVGLFNAYGATRAHRLAGIDLTTNQLLSLPEPNATVTALAAAGAELYVSGIFSHLGGQARRGLASIETPTGTVTAFSPATDSLVAGRLVVDSGRLFVAGFFTAIDGQPRAGLAAFDTASGALTAFNPPPLTGTGTARSTHLVAARGRLWVSGSFTTAGTSARAGLAVFDAVTGALSPIDPQPNSEILGLAFDGGSYVYASGLFNQIGGQARPGLARFNAATGALEPWTPAVFGPSFVAALPGLVFTSGVYSTPGASQAGLVAFDDTGGPSAWRPLAAGQPSFAHVTAEGLVASSGGGSALGPGASPLHYAIRTAGGAPAAPVDFGVLVQGTRVSLRWTPSPNGARVTSYRVVAGSRPGAADLANVVIAPTPGLVVDVPPGRYFVRLVPQANGADGPSTPELAFVSGAVGCASIPGTPTLHVNGAVLQWTTGAGAPPTGYELRAGLSPGALTLTVPLDAATTSFSAATAPPGTYYVAVAAVNACGVSPVSNEVQVVVTPPSPPGPPTNLTAAVVNGTTVRLTWTAPAGTVTGYRLEAGTASGLSNLVPGVDVALTPSITVTSVPRGRYYVRLRALNGTLASAPSPEVVVDVP